MSRKKGENYSRLVMNIPSKTKSHLRILSAMAGQTMTSYINSLIDKEVQIQLKLKIYDRK